MNNKIKIIFLFILTNFMSLSFANLADNTYMISGIVSGAGAAALGVNVPLGAGLGLFLTYLYMNQPEAPNMDNFFEDTGVEIVEDKQGTSLLLPVDTMFIGPINNPTIDVHYYPILNTVLKAVKHFSQLSIKITGHTDNIMDLNDNFVSSDKYAWAVTNYLLGKGVSPRRIIAVEGKANLSPLVDSDSSKARAYNRRVEITLLTKKKINFSGSKYTSFRNWAQKHKR